MYSVSNSTTLESQRMLSDRSSTEESATGEADGQVARTARFFNGPQIHGTTDKAYGVSMSEGGATQRQVQTRMDNSAGEVTDARAYRAASSIGNFSEGDFTSPVENTLTH
jgi:hypothetical protein